MPKKVVKKKEKEKKVVSSGDFSVTKFMEGINKKFGVNALMSAKDIVPFALQRIPTGSISLDIAMGGGIPVGRFIHLCGLESSFKSTTLYHIFANGQKMGFKTMLVNSETGSFTKEYAEQLGVDTDELIVNQSGGMEESLEMLLVGQRMGITLQGIDSIESLVPVKEYESDMNETVQMGIKPKLLGEFLRKFSANNNMLLREGKQPCTLIGLNQLRDKIGAYGDPLYAPGGHALHFSASIETMFRKGDVITKGEGVNRHAIGQVIKFKVNKNKVSVPFKTGEFDIYFDEGGTVLPGYVDNNKEIVLEGIAYGIIDKSGGWFSYKDIKVQGADKLIQVVKKDKKVFNEIRQKLMDMLTEETDEIVEEDD